MRIKSNDPTLMFSRTHNVFDNNILFEVFYCTYYYILLTVPTSEVAMAMFYLYIIISL